jgi:hypothetical protein
MVEDSIMQKFSIGTVATVGVDVWNSSDAQISSYLSATGATFPVTEGGAATGTSYGVVANSMVVIDRTGIVRYVKQLGTGSTTTDIMSGMVSEAASTVRGLLSNSAIQSPLVRNGPCAHQSGLYGEFTLSGRLVSGRAVSSTMLVSLQSGKPGTVVPVVHKAP